ncbi:MAG: N-formylglutamate amidohydrolase [archaeon]|nr:N-formylglutamate amidohydrolase [archaeon]
MRTLITIPHHSTLIPPELKGDFLLEEAQMNRHLDFGTQELFWLEGHDVLLAKASRFVVDVNRERDDLAPGQGVIITQTWGNEKVLARDLTAAQIASRLKKYYDPFYGKLDEKLAGKKPLFVLDAHSMDSKGGFASADAGKKRPQICFATGKGTISDELLEIFERNFKKAGYKAERNNPYSGARAKIIHYASARKGVQALELEVNKNVYMDEKKFALNAVAVKKFRDTLSKCLEEIEGL